VKSSSPSSPLPLPPLTASPYSSGVLRRFGQDIHDDPRVAFRALVDRAHEACMRHVLEPRGAGRPVPAILVTTQTIGGVNHVAICDNGAHLAADDVRRLYATSRSGRAGAVRRALSETGAARADTVVGRFGVAMLAAFLIADEVVITTRSHDAVPDDGVRYACTSRTYHVVPHRVPRAGTLIQLRLRPECQALGEVGVVRAALVAHARTLELPIRVGADPVPIHTHPRG
jgi:molecular chaperone HtpG